MESNRLSELVCESDRTYTFFHRYSTTNFAERVARESTVSRDAALSSYK